MQKLYEGKSSLVTVSFFAHPTFCSVICSCSYMHTWFFKESLFKFQPLINDFQWLTILFVIVPYTLKHTIIGFHWNKLFCTNVLLEIRDSQLSFFLISKKQTKKKEKRKRHILICRLWRLVQGGILLSFRFKLPDLIFQLVLSLFPEAGNNFSLLKRRGEGRHISTGPLTYITTKPPSSLILKNLKPQKIGKRHI